MKNVLRTLVYDGQVSLMVADTTEIVKEAIRLHNLSISSALVLGKALSAMTFACSGLKEETGEISLSMKCNGTAGGVGISANRALKLRGYIENPIASGSEEECWGQDGTLAIIRDDGYFRPFVGTCAFPEQSGVDAAFEEYYRTSEQLPTRIATAVEFSESGECTFAGVVALQPLPFADEETLERVKNAPLTELVKALEGSDVETFAKANFAVDINVWDLRSATYKCNCSKEYLTRVLIPIGEDELRKIAREDGAIRVHCHYCNKDYEFNEEDIDAIF